MSTFSQKEPVALGALVQGALNAVLLLLSAFHLASLSGDQTAAVFAFANIAVIIAVAVKTRRVVFSPFTVANTVDLPPLPGTQPGPTPQGGPQSPDEV